MTCACEETASELDVAREEILMLRFALAVCLDELDARTAKNVYGVDRQMAREDMIKLLDSTAQWRGK
jgi:hypothetical protein